MKDKTGYKKPPKEHQFQKGKSGNPKGRPRKPKPQFSIDDAEILRRLDAEEISVGGVLKPRREVEVMQIVRQALQGNRKARKLMNQLSPYVATEPDELIELIPWQKGYFGKWA